MSNYSFVQLPGNGVTANFQFNFPYMQRAHISVKVNGVAASFTWLTSNIVQISPVPPNSSVVEIRRNTPIDTPVVDYFNGSVLSESDLDASAIQEIYIAQEQADQQGNSIKLDSDGSYSALNRRIKLVDAPTQPDDAATKEYVDAQFASSGGGHALTTHTDMNSGAAINPGSLMVANDDSPSKMDTLPVGAKGSILIGKPTESKKIAWVPVGADYAHLIADSGKADGLRWVPSHTYSSQEMEMVADGATENYSKLNAGITALPAAGGRLFLGPGTFNMSGMYTVNKPLIVEGCGMGVTILQVTSLVNLQHLFALSRSAIFRNLTIKIQTPSSTDYAMNAIRLDLNGGGVSNQFLICENVETLDFDMGMFADGGGIDTEASLIDYVLYRGCRNRIMSAVDIPREPLTAHRCTDVLIDSCYSDNNGDGDHAIYAIRNKRLRVLNSRQVNTPYHGIKAITNPGDAGTLEQWRFEGCRFDTNDTHIVVSITDALVLPQLTMQGITGKTSAPRDASPAGIWVVAANTAEIEQIDFQDVHLKNMTKGGIVLDVGATAKIRHVTCDNPRLINWSTSSAGTYSGIQKNGPGLVESVMIDNGYFDGNNNGKKPFNLVGNGVIPYIGKIFVKGCTDMDTSLSPPTAQVGKSSDQANVVGVVARHTTQNGTTAVTTEETLFTYQVKANALGRVGATFRMKASGRFAGNANTKTLRGKWGSTVLIVNDTSAAPNNLHWVMEVAVTRIGTAQQRCYGTLSCGSALQSTLVSFTTLDETAANNLTITGQNGTANVDGIILSTVEVTFSE